VHDHPFVFGLFWFGRLLVRSYSLRTSACWEIPGYRFWLRQLLHHLHRTGRVLFVFENPTRRSGFYSRSTGLARVASRARHGWLTPVGGSSMPPSIVS